MPPKCPPLPTLLLPATPPKPYYSRDFDPIWAAAQANGVHVFIHTQTGGVKVNDPEAITLKVVMENAQQVNQPMTEKAAAKRMVTQAVYSTLAPEENVVVMAVIFLPRQQASEAVATEPVAVRAE